MKILILGANGQVGWELRRLLARSGGVTAWDRSDADLEDTARLRSRLLGASPDVIVNAAAYTAVDRAETDCEAAFRVNAEAVGVLAESARETGAWLVHYSTDYVFDGEKSGPYVETDAPNPLSVYGRSKLGGEVAIRESGCRHLVLRTSWVFASRGRNFLKTILGLAAERDELRIVDDQQGAPTGARLIAEATRTAIERLAAGDAAGGTYHLAARGGTTWCGYARFVIGEARRLGCPMRVRDDRIVPIPTAAYPQPARRPLNSTLNTDKIVAWLGIQLPPWQAGVREALMEIVSNGARG